MFTGVDVGWSANKHPGILIAALAGRLNAAKHVSSVSKRDAGLRNECAQEIFVLARRPRTSVSEKKRWLKLPLGE